MKLLRYHLCLFGLASLAFPSTLIYGNFDPKNVTYYGGWGVYGTANSIFPGAFSVHSMGFTPVVESYLTSIEIAMASLQGTKSVILTLNADSSGVPGAVMASWTLDSLPPFAFCCTALTVTAAAPIPLVAGTRYWVTAAPGADDTQVVWTNTNTRGPLASQSTVGGPFTPGESVQSAFAVSGIVVPEPASFLLLASAFPLFEGARRLVAKRRRR